MIAFATSLAHSTTAVVANPFESPSSSLDRLATESVREVEIKVGKEKLKLETTVYRPKTAPPWPLVVFNHGADGKLKSYHLQDRERPQEVAKFFLERGYLVVAPMREGFAHSTGRVDFHCDHAHYAKTYQRDIAAAVDAFVSSGEVKKDQIVVVGQSNGGMVALGYATQAPIARALLNFSGGINTEGPRCNWQPKMLEAGSELGAEAKIPSLWLYAEDDKIFPPSISKPFFDNYHAKRAQSEMIMFKAGGHGFAYKEGSSRFWGPDVDRFLKSVGLPVDIHKVD